jgi:hypothetical protein
MQVKGICYTALLGLTRNTCSSLRLEKASRENLATHNGISDTQPYMDLPS